MQSRTALADPSDAIPVRFPGIHIKELTQTHNTPPQTHTHTHTHTHTLTHTHDSHYGALKFTKQ